LKTLEAKELRHMPTLLLQLSYPTSDPEYAATILRSIEELGVEALELEDTGSLRLIGKGFRNIVLVGVKGGVKVALKVRRSDYAEKSTWREAYMLGLANRVGVGPRLLGHSGPVLVMSLVKGIDLSKWLLHESYSPHEAKQTLLETARQCHMLDQAGIDHRELSDATKHVIVTEEGPVVIDFGSAAPSSHPKNLTSLMNYIYSKPLEDVRTRLGLAKMDRERLRRYKATYSREDFEALLATVGLL